jgi:hypothetical protein
MHPDAGIGGFFGKNAGLGSIKANKADLIAQIQKNRDAHREVFLKAHKAYGEALDKALEARLSAHRRGEHITLYFDLPEPEDHTKDYDVVLGMLNLSVDDQLVITDDQYRQFMLDDWGWKQVFEGTVSRYTS